MSSSSDSDSDENTKMLLASVDTNFISDKMYKKSDSIPEKTSNPKQKSNRYIEEEEIIFQSDINVSESMKKYVGQKFSELVAKQVEFVNVSQSNGHSSSKNVTNGIKLLRGGPVIDVNKDPNPDLPEMADKPMVIRKRMIEKDPTSEKDKILSAIIESDHVLDGSETKHWKSRRKERLFEYKTKNGVCYLREPENEFTKFRNKNNWNESKIKDFVKKK